MKKIRLTESELTRIIGKIISESDFESYSHFDALDADAAAQKEQYGEAVPIVYDGFDTGGVAHKVLEAPVEETPAQ